MENNNMKNFERKVLSSFFKDGTLDLSVGLLFLFFGLSLVFTRLWFGDFWGVMLAVLPSAIIYAIIHVIKNKVTKPRLGTIIQKQTMKGLSVIIILALIVCIGIAVYFFMPDKSAETLNIVLFVSIIPIFFTVAAYIHGVTRLVIYGVLAGIIIGTAKIVEGIHSIRYLLPASLLLFSLICFAIGVTILIRFIKNNPKVEIE